MKLLFFMKGDTVMKKTAMITGASRGIGKAIAFEFAKAGYHLILICKNSEAKLYSVARELENTYAISCFTFVGDMGCHQQVTSLFSKLSNSDLDKSIDVLINNVGISYIGLFTEMTLIDWNNVMTTNLTSAFLCSQQVLPYMISNKRGKIINISSVWGNVGASMEVAYSTSKAGLNGLTKSLAKELAPSNIQVNAIACGLIDTDMNDCFSENDMAIIIEEIPANRMGTSLEVGKLVLQLATGNEYLTGQIINLDGGWV